MKPEQVHSIRESFAEISRLDHVAALVSYRRLFKFDPALRSLFTLNIEDESRKLMDMLGALIAMAGEASGLDHKLRAMGARHVGYGVKDAHYATVGAALLAMLSETLGSAFTPEVRGAWTALYGAVETTMKAGAAAVPH
ncbi:MAG: hypothetical protein JWO89_1910 [Verrucomicrobiaceae bacterium]|nr:hypothetical protein [Verrucomicrobiaceae bacterium]